MDLAPDPSHHETPMTAEPKPVAAVRGWPRPETIFLLLALPFGLLFGAVFPPFANADEPNHFLRAYSIAAGRAMPQVRAGGAGDVVPASLPRLIADLAGDLPQNPYRKVDPRAIFAALSRPLDGGQTAWAEFRNTSFASPLPYLPAAAGIALGRLMGAPPLALLYLGRLANLLTGCALIWMALRIAPARRRLWAAIALLPMTMALLVALSADSALIGLASLWTALVARAALPAGRPASPRDVAALALVAAALCLTKLPYVTLVLLAAMIPASRLPRRVWSSRMLIAATSAAAAAFSVWAWRRLELPMREGIGVETARQWEGVVAHPLRFAWLMLQDAIDHGPRYGVQMVGVQLGWLDARVPWAAVFAAVGLLAWLTLAEVTPRGLPTPRQRLVLLAAVAAAWTLVSASQYVIFTPYGADAIEGLQGRYLLPLAPAGALLLQSRRFAGLDAGRWQPAIAALQATILVAALWGVIARYYMA